MQKEEAAERLRIDAETERLRKEKEAADVLAR